MNLQIIENILNKLIEYSTVGGAGAVGVQGNAVADNGNVAIPMQTYDKKVKEEEDSPSKHLKNKKTSKNKK